MSTGTSIPVEHLTVCYHDLLRLGACDTWVAKWKRRYGQAEVEITTETLTELLAAHYPISWFIGAAYGDVPDEVDRRHARLIMRAIVEDTRHLARAFGVEASWDAAVAEMDANPHDTYLDIVRPMDDGRKDRDNMIREVLNAVSAQGSIGQAFESADDLILGRALRPKALILTRHAMVAYFDEAREEFRRYIDGCPLPH
jgi:hypothetical protein